MRVKIAVPQSVREGTLVFIQIAGSAEGQAPLMLPSVHQVCRGLKQRTLSISQVSAELNYFLLTNTQRLMSLLEAVQEQENKIVL
jgi:hypothetical protein